MSLLIRIPLLLLPLQATEHDRPIADLEARVLEAAGVTQIAPTEETTYGLMIAPHSDEIGWRRPVGSRMAFLPLPGARGRLDPSLQADSKSTVGYAGWRSDLPETPLLFHPETLTFVQEGATSLARARVSALPSDPSRTDPLVLTRASAGCSMSPQFELPLELDETSPTLEFLWDLHSPARLDGLVLSLHSDSGRLGRVPMSLEVSRRPVVVDPEVAEFGEGGLVVIEVRSELDPDFEVLTLICPPCCEAVEYERLGFCTRVRLRETDVARRPHACASLTVNVRLGDDPRPFAAFVRLHHTQPITDASARRLLRGAFLAGERVLVTRRGSEVPSLLYPDRFPDRCTSLTASGHEVLGELSVDTESDTFDRSVTTSEGDVRVVGPVARPVDFALLTQIWSELRD